MCGLGGGEGIYRAFERLKEKKNQITHFYIALQKKKIFLYLNHVNSLPSIRHENTVLFLTFCNIFSKSKKQKEHFFNFLTQPGKLRTMNYRRKREGGILSLCWCWKFYISHLIKKKKTEHKVSLLSSSSTQKQNKSLRAHLHLHPANF